MEGDLAGLDFSVLLVHLVSDKNDGDVVTDTGEILVPLGDILVGDSGGDIEHDDRGVSTDVVAFPKTSELFLASSIPKGKLDGPVVGVESDGGDLNSLSGDVFLFEFSSDVPLDKGSLANTSVSDEDNLELSNSFRRFHEINDNHMKLRPLLIILQNSRIKFINLFSKLQATKHLTIDF